MAEISAIEPREGEEAKLAEERALLVNRERIMENLTKALSGLAGETGGEHALDAAARALERAKAKSAGRLDAAAAALERAIVETREAIAELETASRALGQGPLEPTRKSKSGCSRCALLPASTISRSKLCPLLHQDFATKLGALDDGGRRSRR